VLALFIYIKWKFHPYIHHSQPLAPIVEHYKQHRLLLERDVLTMHCGEDMPRHNTLQAFFKQCLAKRLAPKILYYVLWGSIYSKGWGDPWHSPLTLGLPSWLFKSHSDCSHSTSDTWNFTYNMFTIIYIFHMYPCETKYARDNLIRKNTMTPSFGERLTQQHQLDASRSCTDVKLGIVLWCPQTAWCCLVERKLLPPWNPSMCSWNMCPSRPEACTTLC